MTVEPNYMLEKPSGPSRSKLFLDQTVVPALANAAGAVEGGMERAVIVARRNPVLAVGLATGLGLVVSRWRARRHA